MTATDSSRVSVAGPAEPSRAVVTAHRRPTRSTPRRAARSPIRRRGGRRGAAGRRAPPGSPRAPGSAGSAPGLARHLGWPVMVIRIAFVALMTFQFIGVLAYGALWLLLPPEPVAKRPGPGVRRAGPGCATRPDRGAGSTGACCWPSPRSAPDCCGSCRAAGWGSARSCSGRWPSPAPGPPWSGGRPTARSSGAGGPRPAARSGWRPFVARGGWPALVRVIVGLGLVGAAFGIVIAQQSQIQQLPEVMAMTTLALAGLAHRAGAVAVPVPDRAEPGPGREGPRRRPGRHGRPPARLGAADPGPDPAPGRRPQGRPAARPAPGARAADLAVRRGAARPRPSRRR